MRRRFPLFLLLTLIVLFGGATGPQASTAPPDKVFVLVGDEQALGRGLPLSAGESPVPTLLAWENGNWQTAVDPVAQAPTADDGVGPAMSLGKTALAELGGPSVGLVNCGTPKTPMTSWQGNKLLYRKCVDAARPFSGRIAGIFFVEGTWDSTKKTIGSTWLKSFRKTLTAFRNDLGADIPAVVAELGNIQGNKFKYVSAVQAAQAQAATVGNTSVVPTSNLPIAADGVDFTVDSYKSLGEQLAVTWWDERAQPIASLSPPDQVFILAGQSNMLGRGQPSSDGADADPSLWNWRAAFWRVAHDPLGTPTDPENGVGPGMTFGKAVLAAEPGQRIGIVMCARGSTNMDSWVPGQGPYESCVRQATATGATVAGLLFLQGEADASQAKLASAWAAKFQKMLTGLRSIFGPNLPAVIGEIGNIAKKGNKYAPIVRQQQELAATQNAHVAVFSTLDLPIGPDGLHFTVPAYKTVGERFAAAWLSLP